MGLGGGDGGGGGGGGRDTTIWDRGVWGGGSGLMEELQKAASG